MLILRVGAVTYRGNTDTKYLRDCRISSEYAETAHHALELMGHYNYDLILADLNMDDMLGNDMIPRGRTRWVCDAHDHSHRMWENGSAHERSIVGDIGVPVLNLSSFRIDEKERLSNESARAVDLQRKDHGR